MSASTRKFLFERDFDHEILHGRAVPLPPPVPVAETEPPLPEAEPEPPPEPTYSAAEVEAARAAGYAEGDGRARQEVLAGIEQATAAALTAIDGALAGLAKTETARNTAEADVAVAVGVAIMRKLLPEAARRNDLVEVEAALAGCLRELTEEARVTIRVPADLIDRLGSRLEPLAARNGFEGRLVLLAEPELGPGDCRIEWAHGGLERSQDKLWQDIDRALARMMATPDRGGSGEAVLGQEGQPPGGPTR